eukprot:1179874-Prorocentrum_minimum.AAC.4
MVEQIYRNLFTAGSACTKMEQGVGAAHGAFQEPRAGDHVRPRHLHLQRGRALQRGQALPGKEYSQRTVRVQSEYSQGVHYNEAKHCQVTVTAKHVYNITSFYGPVYASNGKGAHTAPQKGLTFSVVDAVKWIY